MFKVMSKVDEAVIMIIASLGIICITIYIVSMWVEYKTEEYDYNKVYQEIHNTISNRVIKILIFCLITIVLMLYKISLY